MTTPPPASPGTAGPLPQPQPKPRVHQRLEPEPGSDLSLLFTQLPVLEAAKAEAEAALKAHKKKIQAEIGKTVTDPSQMPDVFNIPADPYGGYPAYTLSARAGQKRLNAEAMKAQDPDTYEKWVVQGEPYWELARVRVNRVHR